MKFSAHDTKLQGKEWHWLFLLLMISQYWKNDMSSRRSRRHRALGTLGNPNFSQAENCPCLSQHGKLTFPRPSPHRLLPKAWANEMVVGSRGGGSLDLQGAGVVSALLLEGTSKDLHVHGAMASHNYLQSPMPSPHDWASASTLHVSPSSWHTWDTDLNSGLFGLTL